MKLPKNRWLRIVFLSGIAAFVSVGLYAAEPWLGAFVVALGIGNEFQFSSQSYQLVRANQLLNLSGRPSGKTLAEATAALLPPQASQASWSYDTGDDTWLCGIGTLVWRERGEARRARWVLRYCLDRLWREHFVEAAALDDQAARLTPSLEKRGAIYSLEMPYTPRDGASCILF